MFSAKFLATSFIVIFDRMVNPEVFIVFPMGVFAAQVDGFETWGFYWRVIT